jgi:hypothetical protein
LRSTYRGAAAAGNAARFTYRNAGALTVKKTPLDAFYYMWRILLLPLFVALLVTTSVLLNRRKEKRAFQRMQKLFEDELSRNPRVSKDNP